MTARTLDVLGGVVLVAIALALLALLGLWVEEEGPAEQPPVGAHETVKSP